jgi:hypothetical protein
MTVRIPGFTAASSLRLGARASYSSDSEFESNRQGAIVPQAQNTGGGPQNQDSDWCDFKYALCMIGCSFKGLYWWFKFDGQVGALPAACEVSCMADRAVCRIT